MVLTGSYRMSRVESIAQTKTASCTKSRIPAGWEERVEHICILTTSRTTLVPIVTSILATSSESSMYLENIAGAGKRISCT